MKLKRILYLGLAGLMIAGVGSAAVNLSSSVYANRRSKVTKIRKQHKYIKKSTEKQGKTVKGIVHKRGHKQSKAVNPTQAMRKPISYRKSSETIPYPTHLNARKDKIIVSLKKQRAYLMHGKKILYEFYVSTGKNVRGRRTPKGHYRIDGYRARWFYSPGEHEGARYAVGWKDWGLYLFHETPSNSHGKIIKSVARDLGKKGSSYGCVHLSISDAKWFYRNVPTGMSVYIK